jgi:hypothetical protein
VGFWSSGKSAIESTIPRTPTQPVLSGSLLEIDSSEIDHLDALGFEFLLDGCQKGNSFCRGCALGGVNTSGHRYLKPLADGS